MKRRILALLTAVILLTSIAPRPTAAYHLWSSGSATTFSYTPTETTTRSVYVCFASLPDGDNGYFAERIMDAAYRWNNETYRLRFHRAPSGDCTSDLQNTVQVIWKTTPSTNYGDCYSFCTTPPLNIISSGWTKRIIYIYDPFAVGANSWWEPTDQTCVNSGSQTWTSKGYEPAYNGGNDCRNDLFGAMMHEFGHAAGLAHNPYDTADHPDTWYCDWNYTYDHAGAACDPQNGGFGDNLMYPIADGYKRRLTADDRSGIRYLYGAP